MGMPGMGINMNVNAQPGFGQPQQHQQHHDKKGKGKKHDNNFGQPQSAQINMGFGGMPGVNMTVQQTGFDQQGFGQPGQPQQANVNMNMWILNKLIWCKVNKQNFISLKFSFIYKY